MLRRLHAAGLVLASAAALGALLGCNEYGIPAGTSPHREFNVLDMGDQPKAKAQRGDLLGGPAFLPPAGAIPRGYDPYPFVGQPDAAGAQLKNPLPPDDPKVAERGKIGFERYCVPCHDAEGSGNGKVIEKGFPLPPNQNNHKMRDWSDGRIFHVISQGQNIMPSYATQVRPHDRWAVIAYLRVLQSRLPVAPPATTAAAPPEPAMAPPATSAAVPAGSAVQPATSAPAPSSSAVNVTPRAASATGAQPPAPRALPAEGQVK